MNNRSSGKPSSNQGFSLFGALKSAFIYLILASENPLAAAAPNYRQVEINTFNGLTMNSPQVALPGMESILAYDITQIEKTTTKKPFGQNKGRKYHIKDAI
jgi:hypothetical protein